MPISGAGRARVNPVFPDSARANQVQGTLILKALIGKDGLVEDLTQVCDPEELRAAAIAALQQWQYRPYTLNGEAVRVDTTINVNFQLKR